jgi:hypothetical protein
LKRIFIPFPTTIYGKTAAYIFVEFLMNRAGRSNCGGAAFRLRLKAAKYEYRSTKQIQNPNHRMTRTERRALQLIIASGRPMA